MNAPMTDEEFAEFNLREQCIDAMVAAYFRQAQDDVPIRYAKTLEGSVAMFYDTVAPIIRADERGHSLDTLLAANVRHVQFMADLHAKVEALPTFTDADLIGHLVWRSDVLDLFDGGK